MLLAEDIERSPGVPLEQLLVARVPGVSLGRAADGRLVLRIRGTSTVTGSEEPLYVLDGIPLEPHPSGNLNAVDRHDIASIEVLKDAASTAMYGVRGAGGIILIKTKRPPAPLPRDSQ
jgi:TonB-dependent SusC/RagA subfamily outer membrane receptor